MIGVQYSIMITPSALDLDGQHAVLPVTRQMVSQGIYESGSDESRVRNEGIHPSALDGHIR